MIVFTSQIVLSLLVQVPPPNLATKVTAELRHEVRSVLSREAVLLRSLAGRLIDNGNNNAYSYVCKYFTSPPDADGASLFTPLPEVDPPRRVEPENLEPWQVEFDAVREGTANALFDLATRAATGSAKDFALADSALRGVILRRPNNAEARRLLGFAAHEGGWAKPFAIQRSREGMVPHRRFGWVKSDWVQHLERGELPAPAGRGDGQMTWLPAEQANALRDDWAMGWRIHTEHFLIATNVPLAEAIVLGRQLETLHELFQSLFANVLGPNLPLSQRFLTKAMVGEAKTKVHNVSYFATRKQFIEHLRGDQGDEIEQSIGYYAPPKPGRSTKPGSPPRGHAYFFRDEDEPIPSTATLYHEVSHQLLFESGVAVASAFQKNAGNYWVFEGLGTFFETLTPQEDGTIKIGGRVGPRLRAARLNLVEGRLAIPLDAFVAFDKDRFNRKDDVIVHYQEAMALTLFLFQANDSEYRERFLEYVKDACLGRMRRTGWSLESRVKLSYAKMEADYLAYLKGLQPGE